MYYFGKRTGFLSTVAVVAVVLGAQVSAQSLRNANPPAELPPSSYSANQYIDSNGCVFVRAGIGGTTNWVPRVSRSREQLCGFQPTRVAGASTPAPAAPAPTPAPVPEPVVTAAAPAPAPAPAVTPTPAPAPVVAAAPQPAPRPAPTVAARPAPVANASPSPQVIRPTTTTAPTRNVITLAEACAGRTGIQPNMISQRTGRAIDCGGATPQRVTPVAAPIARAPVPAPARPTTQRLTRAEACAAISATGQRYVSATTGLPLQCGTQAVTAPSTTSAWGRVQADLRAPQRPYSNPLDLSPGTTRVAPSVASVATGNRAPYSNPLDAAPGSTTFTPNLNTQVTAGCSFGGVTSEPGLPMRCHPQGVSTTVAQPQVTRRATALNSLLGQEPAPYSNPTRSFALPAPTTPEGYTSVWDDGRLNTQRGLPSYRPTTTGNVVRYAVAPTTQTQVQQQPATTARAVAPAPRVEQISGHRYVQVATFGTRDQAQSVAQALRARGLPMRVGVYNSQGREMRIVLAGPFANDQQLQSALGTARSAGYSGAFTRR